MIDLSIIPIAAAQPAILDMGGVQGSAGVGTTSRLNRLGNRWQWGFTTIAATLADGAMLWSSLLTRARIEGARIEIPQPGILRASGSGNPKVATNLTSGRGVPVTGFSAGFVLDAGRWASIIHAGQRYLDQIAETAVMNGSGGGAIILQNLMRTPLSQNDVIEIDAPKIEGIITDFVSWPLDDEGKSSFSFTIEEAA